MTREDALKCLEIKVDSIYDLSNPDELTLMSAFQLKKIGLEQLVELTSPGELRDEYKRDLNDVLEAYALLNLTLQRVEALHYLRIDSPRPDTAEIERAYKSKKAFIERAIESAPLGTLQSEYETALANVEKANIVLMFSESLDIPYEEEKVEEEEITEYVFEDSDDFVTERNYPKIIGWTLGGIAVVATVILFLFVYQPMQRQNAERMAREEFVADSTRLLNRLVMSYFIRAQKRRDVMDTTKSIDELEREIRQVIADSLSKDFIEMHRSGGVEELSIEAWEREERQFAEADRLKRQKQLDHFEEVEAKRSKQVLITSRSDMKFVKILGGEFDMGTKNGSSGEIPVHKVKIEPFFLGLTEVTHGQWSKLMPLNPSQNAQQQDNHPIENVSWEDVYEFIQEMNDYDRKYDFRLPSEAEWEYACRAGTTTHYNTGKTLPVTAANYDIENTKKSQRFGFMGKTKKKAFPVGFYEPNDWGLYDMHGNVWEWCQDWFHINYKGAPNDGSAWEFPTGTTRVIRGGGYYSSADDCRSEYRLSIAPSSRHEGLGFRLVLIVKE